MTYLDMVKDSIEEYIGNNGLDAVLGWCRAETCEGLDDLENRMCDILYSTDDITGYESKSYYFDADRAKEMVFDNPATVEEALIWDSHGREDEAKEMFKLEQWELIDMTARCYVLDVAVSDYVTEHKEELEALLTEWKGA